MSWWTKLICTGCRRGARAAGRAEPSSALTAVCQSRSEDSGSSTIDADASWYSHEVDDARATIPGGQPRRQNPTRALLATLFLLAGCAVNGTQEVEDSSSTQPAETGKDDTTTAASTSSDSTGMIGTCPAVNRTLAAIPEAEVASAAAAHWCMVQIACACDGASHDTVPSCRHSTHMDYVYASERAQEAGLTYDGHCLAEKIARIQGEGCDTAQAAVDSDDDPASPWGAGHCSVFHGSGTLGEPCKLVDREWRLSDCAQGLSCHDGRCIDPCAAAAKLGARCSPFSVACAPGEICTGGGRPCLPGRLAGTGELCGRMGDTLVECTADHWCHERNDCSGESECTPKLEVGVSCWLDRSCASGFCADGRCQVGPVTGEACISGRCLEGRECIDGVCGPPEARICRFTGDRVGGQAVVTGRDCER